MMKTPLAIVVLYLAVTLNGLTIRIHEHVTDPRVQDWFLMKRWTPILLIMAAYFLIVMIGPKLMQNRKPFELKTSIRAYNLLQVFLCGYMFKEFLASSWQAGYSLKCQPVDYSNSPLAIRMATASWWFFFSKIVDLLDTIFFILRKKNGQISFLHVYHHGTMIFNWWFVAKYTPGGQVFFQCMLNSFVHVVMYTYYFCSSFGPAMQPYLWWKRYLTQFQLIQFVAIIIHLVTGMTQTCEFPQIFYFYVIVYCVTLIALFTNFYVETYSHVLKDRAAAAKREEYLIQDGGKDHNNNNNNGGNGQCITDGVGVDPLSSPVVAKADAMAGTATDGEIRKRPMGIIIHRTPCIGDKPVNSNSSSSSKSSPLVK